MLQWNEMANLSRRTASSWNHGKRCPYCPKDFFKADHYDRHVRSHTKEKPFSCKSCGKSYPRHDTMLRHIRTHHKEQTPSSLISDATESAEQLQNLRRSSLDLDQQQQHLPVYQSPHSLQDGVSSVVLAPQDIQFNINDADANVFPQESNPTLVEDTSNFMPMDLEQPQLTSLDWMDPMSWLLQDDYDLENFNQLIPGISNASIVEPHTDRERGQNAMSSNIHPTPDHRHRNIPDLRRYWHIQVSAGDMSHAPISRGMSPAPNDGQAKADIDETYRVDAATKLLPKIRNEPLPSIGLLNMFIHLFFTRFNIALPLIHAPTFKSNKGNALLVLTICSAGSLWFGSKEATNAGSMLFERVNKAVLESPWERLLLRNPTDSLNTLKVALIGQTYALLCGNPLHLETACGYHGTVLSLARRLKIFDQPPENSLEADPTKDRLYAMWKKWARGEERKRLAACIYVHDAELAALFHHEPLLRHNARRLPKISSPELFHASSAEAWYSRFKAEQALDAKSNCDGHQDSLGSVGDFAPGLRHTGTKVSPSSLEMLLTLSGIGASIAADRRLNSLNLERQTQYSTELMEWHGKTFKASRAWTFPEQSVFQVTLNLLFLWHYTWISLYVDLDVLESAIGREGSNLSQSTIEYVESWASSEKSWRCLFHAWSLQECILRIPPGPAVAIHVPRVLFSAAVVWQCFILYRPAELSTTSRHDEAIKITDYVRSLPEVYTMNREREELQSVVSAALGSRSVIESVIQLQEALGSVLTLTKHQTLHTLADLLRRSSSYGIGIKMADIIEVLLSYDMELPTENNNDSGVT